MATSQPLTNASKDGDCMCPARYFAVVKSVPDSSLTKRGKEHGYIYFVLGYIHKIQFGVFDGMAVRTKESRSGLMDSTQVCQSEGSGQIAYFHGVKTRLSTLGTRDW